MVGVSFFRRATRVYGFMPLLYGALLYAVKGGRK